MALTRSEGWEYKLRLYLDAQREIPFAWGTNDCCTSVCGWIKLCTGTDVFAEFAGKYTDQAGATAAIKAVTGTGSTVEDAAVYIAGKFGLPEIPPAFAQRGDVVLLAGPLGPTLALVTLHAVSAVTPWDKGLIKARTLSAKRAWRVGHA